MKRIRTSAAALANKGKWSRWLEDRNNKAGMTAASQALLRGASEDPYRALAEGVASFFAGRNQEQRRSELEAKEMEVRTREWQRQDAADARAAEQFELTKRATEAQLAEAQAKREMAERQRQHLEKYIHTLPPEDQALLGLYVYDPEKFPSIYDDIMDNRRADSQFNQTFGETQRHNKASEANTSAGLAYERRRLEIAEEAAKLKGEKQTIKRIGNFIITQDARGNEISREALPDNPRDRRNAALRIMEARGSDPKETAALLAELDAELGPAPLPAGIGPAVTHRQNTAPAGDEELLAAATAARAEGMSDAEILAAIEDPAKKARVAALLRRR